MDKRPWEYPAAPDREGIAPESDGRVPVIIYFTQGSFAANGFAGQLAICGPDGRVGGWLEAERDVERGSTKCLWHMKILDWPAAPTTRQFGHLEEALQACSNYLSTHEKSSAVAQASDHDRFARVASKIKGYFRESTKKPDDDPSAAQPMLSEDLRIALLDAAASGAPATDDPLGILRDKMRSETVLMLGGEEVLGRIVRNDEDLVTALIAGFPSYVLQALREAGLPHRILEQVIAPRRTLMRRKAEGQRLTRSESDATWRLGHAYNLAAHVLNGRKAALTWLTRPKAAFSNQTPVDLLETSVGAAQVERMLRQLEWGDVS